MNTGGPAFPCPETGVDLHDDTGGITGCRVFPASQGMSKTPRTDAATWHQRIAGNPLGIDVVSASTCAFIELELNEANVRVKRLEDALGLAIEMRLKWLGISDEGYAGAYYSFVKGNDSDWEIIMQTMETKP